MKLPNRLYDVLKWVAVIALPAVVAFLGSVLPVLGVPSEVTQIVVTVGAALDTLLGALLGVSTFNYNRAMAEKSVEEYESEDDR